MSPRQALGARRRAPGGQNGGRPPTPGRPDIRYLEMFDYVSAVSGGSYVAGHRLAKAARMRR